MDTIEPRTFKVRIKMNTQGDKVYNCPICNAISGTLVVTSRNPQYFTHYYNCSNKGSIPIEEGDGYDMDEMVMKQLNHDGVYVGRTSDSALNKEDSKLLSSDDNHPLGLYTIVRCLHEPIPPSYKQMDDSNKKAFDVLIDSTEDGSMEDFVKHVFTDEKTGQRLSYSEMRMKYG